MLEPVRIFDDLFDFAKGVLIQKLMGRSEVLPASVPKRAEERSGWKLARARYPKKRFEVRTDRFGDITQVSCAGVEKGT